MTGWLRRLFCQHRSTSSESYRDGDGPWITTHWECLNCGASRGQSYADRIKGETSV